MARKKQTKKSEPVTLWGTIVEDDLPGGFFFDVNPVMGDAPRLKISGRIFLRDRQILEIRSVPIGCPDSVVLPLQIARAVAS